MKTKTEFERDYWLSVAALRESQGVKMTASEKRAYAVALENHNRAQANAHFSKTVKSWGAAR